MIKKLLGLIPFLAPLFFLLAAVYAVEESRYRIVTEMPDEVRYRVVIHGDAWPKSYYSESFTLQEPNGFRLETYWTYWQGWHYYPIPIEMTQVDTTIQEIIR